MRSKLNGEVKQTTSHETSQVVEALFATLETMLPHAARLVEQKAQELVEHISALVTSAQAQESNIAQLVGCVQQARFGDQEMPLQNQLKRLQVTLAFSLEQNLAVQYETQQWQEELDQRTKELRDIEQEVAQLTSNKTWGKSAEHIQNSLHSTTIHLAALKKQIYEMTMQPRERALFENDMRAIGEMLAEHPVRTRQLQALLQDANANARQIADTGRAAIMAIQFQDYNTQMTENALKLLQVLRTHVTADIGSEPCGQSLYTACHDALTLGEVRQIFADNFNTKPSTALKETSAPGLIELF